MIKFSIIIYKEGEKMAIIKEYYTKNGTIKIDDTYLKQNKKDIKSIIKNIEKIYYKNIK